MNILMRSGVSAIVVLLVLISVNFSEGTIQPTTFSFAAQNTANGTILLFKDSNSPETIITSFSGFDLSSSAVCGQDYERCPLCVFGANVGVEIIVVMLPLGQNLGIATFTNRIDLNQLVFRDSHVISGQFSDCELTTISVLTVDSGFATVIGVCLQDTLNQVFQAKGSLILMDLTQSFLNPQPGSCSLTNFSEFVVFESESFPEGVAVFVAENGQGGQNVHFQRPGEDCQPPSDGQSICSPVEHFVPVSITQQAVYCDVETRIVDIDSNNEYPVLSRSEFGLPFFCSDTVFIGYGNDSLTLFRGRDALNVSMNFPYGDNVLFGECVYLNSQFFVVARLSNGTVLSANLNQSETVVLEVSVTPPKVFQHSVLLTTATSVVVRSLLNEQFRDEFEAQAVLGAVVNGALEILPTTPPPSTETTPSPTTTIRTETLPSPTTAIRTEATPTDTTGTQSNKARAIIGGVLGALAFVIFVIGLPLLCLGCILWWCCRDRGTTTPIQEVELAELMLEGGDSETLKSDSVPSERPSATSTCKDYDSSLDNNRTFATLQVQDQANLTVQPEGVSTTSNNSNSDVQQHGADITMDNASASVESNNCNKFPHQVQDDPNPTMGFNTVYDTANSKDDVPQNGANPAEDREGGNNNSLQVEGEPHLLETSGNGATVPQQVQDDTNGSSDAIVLEAQNLTCESSNTLLYPRPETNQDATVPPRALKKARCEEAAQYYTIDGSNLHVTTDPMEANDSGNGTERTGNGTGNSTGTWHHISAAEQNRRHGEERGDRRRGEDRGDRRRGEERGDRRRGEGRPDEDQDKGCGSGNGNAG